MAAITTMPQFSWTSALPTFEALRASSSVYWALRLAESLAGMRIPDTLLRRLRPPTPEWLARGIERAAIARIASGEGQPAPSMRVSEWLWRAAIRPRWSGHAAPKRLEQSRRWLASTEAESGAVAKLSHHGRGYRSWLAFIGQTLRG